VLIPFASEVDAILLSSLPGEMGGAAFADILFGKFSPSGHLSVTLPNAADETSVRVRSDSDDYAEGVTVGYRWYQAMGRTPNFAFGWGLSYAEHLEVTALHLERPIGVSRPSVAVTLRWRDATSNVGVVDQVVQLYVQHKQPMARNFRQLAGFGKVENLQLGVEQSAKIYFESPTTWGSAPGDRDAFDADWQDVTEYSLFISLYGSADTRLAFSVDTSTGDFNFVAEHDFSIGPIAFDQDDVVQKHIEASSTLFNNSQPALVV